MIPKISRVDQLAKSLYEQETPHGAPWDMPVSPHEAGSETPLSVEEGTRGIYRARARQQMENDGSLRKFARGELVKPRPGGALEIERYGQRTKEAQVVERMALPATGDRVRVRWNGEYRSSAFLDIDLFDPA